MIALLMISFSTLLGEISACIGKEELIQKRQTVYTTGFLSLFWVFIFIIISSLFITHEFRFVWASLPTFSLRLIFEIIQSTITAHAIEKSDRSTFNFMRLFTIPLLFGVDIILGYKLTTGQLIGMAVIIITLLTMTLDKKFSKKGAHYAAISAINAVITISLYKYNITHFNSVEAEQGIMIFLLLIYFYISALIITKEHPFKMLTKQKYFFQSFSHGLAGIISSFAYLFAPASVIIATGRSTAILWSILSGKKYFHEGNFITKIIFFLFILAGLIFFVV